MCGSIMFNGHYLKVVYLKVTWVDTCLRSHATQPAFFLTLRVCIWMHDCVQRNKEMDAFWCKLNLSTAT